MRFKIKFNIFKLDKSGYPVTQQNITIYYESTKSYDNIRNEILSKYPTAKCIVIYPFKVYYDRNR